MLAERGEHDIAREQIEWVAADDFARLGDDMNRLAALCELAQAMVALEDPTHAQGVLERLEPYADRNVINGRGAAGYGSAAHHVAALAALLGRHDEQRFERALHANEQLGSRLVGGAHPRALRPRAPGPRRARPWARAPRPCPRGGRATRHQALTPRNAGRTSAP